MARKHLLRSIKMSQEAYLKSGYIKQGKLHRSPFDKHSEDFSLVVTERDKFTVKVPVARLYLSQ